MSKRKSDSDEYFRSKLKKLEKQLRIRRKRPVISSDSSSSSSGTCSPAPVLSENVDGPEPPVLEEIDITSDVQEASPVHDDADKKYSFSINDKTEEKSELDDEILALLGDTPSKDKKYGAPIQKDLAIRWEHISTHGLSKEVRKDIIENHYIPENCKLMESPILNREIKAALTDALLKNDKALESKQKQIAVAISCIGEALTMTIASEHKDPKVIKALVEAGRILCDTQHNESLTRRSFICSTIKKYLKDQLYDTEIDQFLFGEKLHDTLKAAKAINKSALEMKVSIPLKSVHQRNKASTSKNYRPPHANNRQPIARRREQAQPQNRVPAPLLPPPPPPPSYSRRRQPPPPPPPRSQPRAPQRQ